MLPKLSSFDPSAEGSGVGASLEELGACLMPAPPVFADMAACCARFFGLAASEKERSRSPHGTLGYRPSGLENLAVDAGDTHDAPPDRNESFVATLPCMGGDAAHGKFNWPDLPGFRETWRQFHLECSAVGDRLLHVILGGPARTAPTAAAHLTRAVRYPPGPIRDGEMGAGEHTDFGWFTLLWANRDGLEIRAREEWITAHIPEGYVLVILGDMAALTSQNRLRAAPHRVSVPRDVRDAVVFFYNPERDTVVRPPDITFETWLTSRDVRRRLRDRPRPHQR